jgi:uncharacterized NAD-dependent epimerase/dehydratase family protein
MRKIVLLTGGVTDVGRAKTAVNLLRYSTEEVVAVYDPTHAGQTSQQLFGVGGNVPVIAKLSDAPTANIAAIGIATPGGKLPPDFRAVIVESLQRGLTVVSGLHQFLSDDAELVALAAKHGGKLEDVRKNNERDVAQRQGLREGCLRIHTVGHDCNIGKMVVSVEISRALNRAGHDAKFIATGQTGIMIVGDGCPVDAVVCDFLNGAVEKLILAHQHHDILLVEGQGSLTHPRYSAVTLGLLHGCVPDGLILCYEMGRDKVMGMDHVPLHSLATYRDLYETMASTQHPCKVIGIAINSRRFSAEEAAHERARIREELGLPVCDVIRDGPQELVEAVLKFQKEIGKEPKAGS